MENLFGINTKIIITKDICEIPNGIGNNMYWWIGLSLSLRIVLK